MSDYETYVPRARKLTELYSVSGARVNNEMSEMLFRAIGDAHAKEIDKQTLEILKNISKTIQERRERFLQILGFSTVEELLEYLQNIHREKIIDI